MRIDTLIKTVSKCYTFEEDIYHFQIHIGFLNKFSFPEGLQMLKDHKKNALFQNTTKQQKHLKKSGYNKICDVIPGHWSLPCLGQSLLWLQERKCWLNSLFVDGTTSQTRKRTYPFIQFLFETDDTEKPKRRK